MPRQAVHGGRQIAGGNRIAVGNGTVFVGRTVDSTSIDTATCQQCRCSIGASGLD